MNKDFNSLLLDCLNDNGKNVYHQLMDNIEDNSNNIKFLLLYAVNEEDHNVVPAINDYIIQTCKIKNANKANLDDVKTLLEIHSKYYEQLLKNFYTIYSGLETSIITLQYCLDEDFNTCLQHMLTSLENLSKSVTYISDFILNYCAIRYIFNKYSMDAIDYISENNLPMGCFDDIAITMEFNIIFEKLMSMIFAYHNQDDNDSKQISMYDTFELAKMAIEDAINKRAVEIANFMDEREMSYNTLNLFIWCTSYFSAVWSILLEQTKYKVSFDEIIPVLFRKVAHELSQEDGSDDKIYCKLKDTYFKEKEQLKKTKKEITSKEHFDKIYHMFRKDVGYIEDINLYNIYKNTIEKIKEIIDN